MNEVGRVMCVGCGYDLFGLDLRGHCPECGRSIEESVLRPKLWEADARWLRRQIVGMWLLAGFYGVMTLMAAGSLVDLLWVFFGWGMGSMYWVLTIASMVLKMAFLIGIGWLLSRPNPMRGVPVAEEKWRKTLEQMTVILAVALGLVLSISVANFLAGLAGFPMMIELNMVARVVLVVGLFLWALFKYVAAMWNWPELTPCGREADVFLPVLLLVVVLGAALAGVSG